MTLVLTALLGSIGFACHLKGHLMSISPSGLRSRHLRLGLPAFGLSLLAVDAEHPVGQLGHLLQVRVQRRCAEQDGGPYKGLLFLGVMYPPIRDCGGLLQDGHEHEAVRMKNSILIYS